ncbi:MAG: leucine-rich repeat protein [Muribaculaceae bacterium]|nr:leucine-rich repeat protein [Muribaculaceae bacterium]
MKKTFKSVIILLATILLPTTAMAYDFMVDDLAYNITGNNIVEVTYNYSPVGYGQETDNYNGLTQAIVPWSVFYNGKTYYVTAIGESAFCSCHSLTSVTIPNTVTTIGADAFGGSRSLTEILIPNTVTTIGEWAFSGCSALTSIDLPNSITSISDWLFEGCKGLTSITIPSSVTSISNNAFLGCSALTSMKVAQGNQFYNSRGDCNAIIETATNTLIAGCKGSVIPGTVTAIGEWAFAQNDALTSIDLPNSVTTIGKSAFYGCKNLTSVTVSNSVTTIGESAFAVCRGLTNISIPNSVTTIGEQAFAGCVSLTEITIPSSVTRIDGNVFIDCSALERIVVEEGNQVYDSRGDCNAIIWTRFNMLGSGCKNTIIPNSVTSIGNEAFRGADLTSIVIPYSVKYIYKEAFYGCEKLTSVTIPNSIVDIGEEAFLCGNESISLTLTGNGKWDHVLDHMFLYRCKTINVGSEITEVDGMVWAEPEFIYTYAQVPPTLDNTFGNYDAELHVPSASLASYFTAPYWKNFSNITNDLTETVTLSQNVADECIVGGTIQLSATATTQENELVWSTSDPAVATVNENGEVSMLSKGQCRIFASLASNPAVYASCLVKVTGVNKISLDKTVANIAPNEILPLTPTYDTDVVKDITATSSDADVAIARIVTVDGAKKVQVLGMNYGTATITVASTNGYVQPATCRITVTDLPLGDLTGDGMVDVEDVNGVVNIILNTDTQQQTTADVNGDGKPDVSDVNAIINIILKVQ